MDYLKQEYDQFLSYVESTFGQLLDADHWKEEPKIEKVIVHKYKNTFDVFVYLSEGVYYEYDFEKSELLEIKYTGEPIKTEYALNDDLILYILLKSNVIKDLGLENVKFLIFNFIDGIKEDKNLSKKLNNIEDDWSYDLYCRIHDL